MPTPPADPGGDVATAREHAAQTYAANRIPAALNLRATGAAALLALAVLLIAVAISSPAEHGHPHGSGLTLTGRIVTYLLGAAAAHLWRPVGHAMRQAATSNARAWSRLRAARHAHPDQDGGDSVTRRYYRLVGWRTVAPLAATALCAVLRAFL